MQQQLVRDMHGSGYVQQDLLLLLLLLGVAAAAAAAAAPTAAPSAAAAARGEGPRGSLGCRSSSSSPWISLIELMLLRRKMHSKYP